MGKGRCWSTELELPSLRSSSWLVGEKRNHVAKYQAGACSCVVKSLLRAARGSHELPEGSEPFPPNRGAASLPAWYRWHSRQLQLVSTPHLERVLLKSIVLYYAGVGDTGPTAGACWLAGRDRQRVSSAAVPSNLRCASWSSCLECKGCTQPLPASLPKGPLSPLLLSGQKHKAFGSIKLPTDAFLPSRILNLACSVSENKN